MEDHAHKLALRSKPTWRLGKKITTTHNHNKHINKGNRNIIQIS